ncbi:MAG: endonuclease Q family protein [archaeon]
MKEFNCDLHYHGLYSGGVSKKMLLPVIAENSVLKGLNVIGSSDILQGTWLKHVKENIIEESNGVFKEKNNNVFVILSTEVECNDRVHHLIYFPDFSRVQEVREKLLKHSNEIDQSWGGRPRIKLNAQQLAEIVFDSNCLLGPSHAFTPYFGIFAHFNSVQEAYGEFSNKIYFMELGLSADTFLADQIKSNHDFAFTTNSDSHSPYPHRIGREFNRIKMLEPSFKELENAFKEREELKIVLNAGFNPKEGKYHCSACHSCYQKVSLEQAKAFKFRCPVCKAAIKKGVKDRINELKDVKENVHPKHRPKYLHLLPLAEILAMALKVENSMSVKVQSLWHELVEKFDNEINILVDLEIEEIAKVNKQASLAVNAFRNDLVIMIPGGGGNYGKPVITYSEKEFKEKSLEMEKELQCFYTVDKLKQKTLNDY